MSSFVWKCLVGTFCVVLASSGGASAQVCGDADNNGQVSVTDGVQALRAAATLPSSCTLATCDVDGNGSVSVTDGVNVLRKAAGLPITENCPGGGTARDQQIETVLRNTVPIFGSLTKGAGAAQAAGTGFACENAEGEIAVDSENGVIFFSNCVIFGLVYDGALGIDETGTTLFFDIQFTDLATEDTFSFSGPLTVRQSGDNLVLDGTLDVSFNDLGAVTIGLEGVEGDIDGNIIAGDLVIDASDSGIDGVVSIRVGFTTSTVVPVTVLLDDQTTIGFQFDTVTFELTPVSN